MWEEGGTKQGQHHAFAHMRGGMWEEGGTKQGQHHAFAHMRGGMWEEGGGIARVCVQG